MGMFVASIRFEDVLGVCERSLEVVRNGKVDRIESLELCQIVVLLLADFLGLPLLYMWGSGRFSGVARDAEYVAKHIKARIGLAPAERQAALNEAAIGS